MILASFCGYFKLFYTIMNNVKFLNFFARSTFPSSRQEVEPAIVIHADAQLFALPAKVVGQLFFQPVFSGFSKYTGAEAKDTFFFFDTFEQIIPVDIFKIGGIFWRFGLIKHWVFNF